MSDAAFCQRCGCSGAVHDFTNPEHAFCSLCGTMCPTDRSNWLY